VDKAHPYWREVRAGIEEGERGETITLTDAEADAWARTGEVPERVRQWHDAQSRSRRST
jgi:hypothetical protein